MTAREAAMERLFKSLNAERVCHRSGQTRREVEVVRFDYCSVYYNLRRRHSALGWKAPCFSREGPLNKSIRPDLNGDRARLRPCDSVA